MCVMNYFSPEGWLKQEQLISVALIVSLYKTELNKARRCRGFIFYRGKEMNTDASANTTHPIIFGEEWT